MHYKITKKETEYLRELAKEQLELSRLPVMAERSRLWTSHNDLNGERPTVYFEMGTVRDRGFLPECICENEAARYIERTLLSNMMNHKMVGDDRVVPGVFGCGYDSSLLPFGLPVKSVRTGGIGYHIEQQIEDLERDFNLLKPSPIEFDRDGSLARRDFAESVIGDILPVVMEMGGFYVCMTNNIIHLMNMENMFCAMYETPELFRAMMDILTSDYIKYLKTLERERMLVLNNTNVGVAQGTFGFTNDLPRPGFDPDSVRTTDCWGFMDSQETVGISPEMFGEFFFPYYKRIADMYGLLSYGCCEPVDVFWEWISKFGNLRKVSVSAWCDEEVMGERLSGSGIIFHRKPDPSFIGLGKELDEDGFRKHIRKTLDAAKGCKLEITFRDVYNLDGNLGKPRRAVEIVREEIEDF